MVDHNNDTTVADLFIPKLETIEGHENKNLFEDHENKHNEKKN